MSNEHLSSSFKKDGAEVSNELADLLSTSLPAGKIVESDGAGGVNIINTPAGGGGGGVSGLEVPWRANTQYGANEVDPTSQSIASGDLYAYCLPVPSSTPIKQLSIIVEPVSGSFPGGAELALALFTEGVATPVSLIAATEGTIAISGSVPIEAVVDLSGSPPSVGRAKIWVAFKTNTAIKAQVIANDGKNALGVDLGLLLGTMFLPATEATGIVRFPSQPNDAHTVTLPEFLGGGSSANRIFTFKDSLLAVAATGTITFPQNPDPNDTVSLHATQSGSPVIFTFRTTLGVKATGSITFAGLGPADGDQVGIIEFGNASTTNFIFRDTLGAGEPPFEVQIGASLEDTRDNLLTQIAAHITTVGVGFGSGPGPFGINLTSSTVGTAGNGANAASDPLTVEVTGMSGGSSGAPTDVLIGIDQEATRDNFVTVINAEGIAITASPSGPAGTPVCDVVQDVAGTAGNNTITSGASSNAPTVAGFSGGAAAGGPFDVLIGGTTTDTRNNFTDRILALIPGTIGDFQPVNSDFGGDPQTELTQPIAGAGGNLTIITGGPVANPLVVLGFSGGADLVPGTRGQKHILGVKATHAYGDGTMPASFPTPTHIGDQDFVPNVLVEANADGAAV